MCHELAVFSWMLLGVLAHVVLLVFDGSKTSRHVHVEDKSFELSYKFVIEVELTLAHHEINHLIGIENSMLDLLEDVIQPNFWDPLYLIFGIRVRIVVQLVVLEHLIQLLVTFLNGH